MALPRHLLAPLAAACALQIPIPAMAQQDAALADLYNRRCSACHGDKGEGTSHVMPRLGPALKGNPFVVNGSIPALRNVIRKGRQGERRLYDDTFPNMPAFGPEPVPDADAMAAYLKGALQK